MFGKKAHGDIKKSTIKIQDLKKDNATRFKHLRAVIDHGDVKEVKSILETNYSHAYSILYDSFIIAETNLKQRELTFHLVHKAQKEELEGVLYVLDRILILCPELLSKRWQVHSLTRMLTKLLHPNNSWKLRREAIRYFIIWYQILGENAPDWVHAIFATLIPGFPSPIEGQLGLTALTLTSTSTVFHDSHAEPVTDVEVTPIFPPQSGEKQPDDPMRFFLEALLEYMVTQICRIEWKDKFYRQFKCFTFLLDKFKQYYQPLIFPEFLHTTSVYKPILELPNLRPMSRTDEFVGCRVAVIKWIASFTQPSRPSPFPKNPSESENDAAEQKKSVSSIDDVQGSSTSPMNDIQHCVEIVREVLFGSRENINFMHEVLRQAFLLPFTHAPAIRRSIAVYKEWVQMKPSEMPGFMLEPPATKTDHSEGEDFYRRLRNDSYIGAMQHSNLHIRAGYQKTLQVIMTHAGHLFLQTVSSDYPILLEEQTDACKKVLNIYRYMVMHVHMEQASWEQLLTVLLKLTSLIFSKTPPRKKSDTLAGKLASVIFQTLLVTWIKANLNVVISSSLWDRLLAVLSCLTQWEELIKEWAKTLETLTRVLARHVYQLDLSDLPLDRPSEHRARRHRRPPSPTRRNVNNTLQNPSSVSDNHSIDGSPANTTKEVIESRPANLSRSVSDSNLLLLLQNQDNMPKSTNQKLWRASSLDSFKVKKNGGTRTSRSPSPAPSNGLESNSPVQIDVLATDNVPSDSGGGRSVMSGGSLRGWLPDVASVLWRRMLGVLGDINQLKDPALHSLVFQQLVNLCNTLEKIRKNQGLAADTPANAASTPPPDLTIIAPWCFQALNLPETYRQGQVKAYKLLCLMTFSIPSSSLPPLHLASFYKVLHQALTASDRSIVNTVISEMGPRILSRQPPGFTLLLLDLIFAADRVLSSADIRTAPRTEAMSILGSLLSLPDSLFKLRAFQPVPNQFCTVVFPDAKDQIVNLLLQYGRSEPTTEARCVALSSLGVFLYQKLSEGNNHPEIRNALDVLLHSLNSKEDTVAHIACDVILLLCDHASTFHPAIPPVIVQAVASTLASLGGGRTKLAAALVFCLGEWTMHLSGLAPPLLEAIFKVLTNIVLESPNHLNNSAHIAAKMVIGHLVNQLGHFPMAGDRLCSQVSEQDDVPGLTGVNQILDALNIQLFVTNSAHTVSFIELPPLEVPGGGPTADLITAPAQVRVILRDLNGKSSWDASVLYAVPDSIQRVVIQPKWPTEENTFSLCAVNNAPQHTLRSRLHNILPTVCNSAPDLDNLNDLLQYVEYTSPECANATEPLNSSVELEQETMSAILGQRFSNQDKLHLSQTVPGDLRLPKNETNVFQYCRLFGSQLGFASSPQRANLFLLSRTEKLIRELRNLDNQMCRETHKIAVIYVGDGQENKDVILSNCGGSAAYEQFISQLAWEVQLDSHTGFMGGLQPSPSTAPYFATSLTEAIFHVATRMPNDTIHNKTRHLGNDEVHIVWCEHSRDYRRSVIPTEFCDVLIVIYPLPYHLFRVTISRKPEIPLCGPLWDEAVVSMTVLAGLIRATAFSASRAKRSTLSFYQHHYEERWRSLETVLRNHKNLTTFEEFSSQLFAPKTPAQNPESFSIPSSEHIGRLSKGPAPDFVDENHTVGISPRPMKKLSVRVSLDGSKLK
nr:PREDICTED: ral GTPase-activating protein subunit alpha-1 isoform X1 [Bemisia tabaci]